jgi:hypothetical protein
LLSLQFITSPLITSPLYPIVSYPELTVTEFLSFISMKNFLNILAAFTCSIVPSALSSPT